MLKMANNLPRKLSIAIQCSKVAAALSCLFFSTSVLAADAPVEELTALSFSDPSYFFQVIVSLGIVIGAIFLLSAVARKFDLSAPKSAGPVRILDTLSIGGKEQLLLVQVGDDQILVGRSANGVEKVHELTTPLSGLEAQQARHGASGFLGRVLNR